MFVSPQFQDDKRTETVFLCSLSPNAHRNCRPTVTTVSTMPTILLCLLCQLCPQMHIATTGCFEKSQDQIQRCRQQSWAFKQVERMSNCPWIQKIANNYLVKCVEKKVFDANGKITRFWSFERSGGKASFCTFDNFQKPGITETGNRKRGLSGFRTARGGKAHILKVKMPLIQLFIKPSSADAPSVVYQANCPAISFVCWTINYLMPLQLFIKPSADKIIHLHGLHRNRSPQSDLCISLLLAKKTILTDAM